MGVWTSLLDLLGCLLDHLDLKFLRMDGQTAVTERQKLIDQYNHDTTIPIFLLSTKACGLGINLTSADTCIMHDLDFNPFNDLQAEDRCHRIGQKKTVTVMKLVVKDSVDSDIYDMQERKAKLNAAIMENSASSNNNSNWGAKQEKNEKELVLETAMDRFLKSPMVKTLVPTETVASTKTTTKDLITASDSSNIRTTGGTGGDSIKKNKAGRKHHEQHAFRKHQTIEKENIVMSLLEEDDEEEYCDV